jgi:hypothetical protein
MQVVVQFQSVKVLQLVANTCPLKHCDFMTKEDANQIAARIIQQTVGVAAADDNNGKNPAAVALGRLGGLKGGRARDAKLSKKRKKEIAKKAAKVRWQKKS